MLVKHLIRAVLIIGLAVASHPIQALGDTSTTTIAISVTIPERVVLEATLDNGQRLQVATRQRRGEVVSLVAGRTAHEFIIRPE
ncbi:hypothetical protein [Litorivivens sp.]|uniref:hypothetical protein n=1 Tax=Litorivivens sp. TaxID=2020868 RepID=UPI00356877E3